MRMSVSAGTKRHAGWRLLFVPLLSAGLLSVGLFGQGQPSPPSPPGASSSSSPRPAPVSASAQRAYEQARGQLVQVRTLLKGQDTQSSVGSGFLVSDEGHIITNYHVVSEVALQPERHRLVYSTVERTEGPLQL